MTARAFKDFLDRVYEKKDGERVQVETKILRDTEVEISSYRRRKHQPARPRTEYLD